MTNCCCRCSFSDWHSAVTCILGSHAGLSILCSAQVTAVFWMSGSSRQPLHMFMHCAVLVQYPVKLQVQCQVPLQMHCPISVVVHVQSNNAFTLCWIKDLMLSAIQYNQSFLSERKMKIETDSNGKGAGDKLGRGGGNCS